ncbi:VOC family protein [Tessaracoccus antarcticus]|uniref:VOC family protein n=1 Tax=Tessaracoccus antarcticus TaxID=2479848 RepID=A0A3M0GW57_9ACTN|nr:VOC family protein [Tessaracoccus antarcticus]RMB61576.1 VOC family protein [Tessaracoccus antarcticus]
MRARLHITSVFVDDQAKALAFYTEQLGFVPRTDVPLGSHRWLTVGDTTDGNAVELLLEPDEHPAAKAFKSALVADGIPCTSFAVDDVTAAHAELEQRGVRFTQAPTSMGGMVTAVLDDTCGNLIQLVSPQ